jgi:superfamily II DNA or RNA helicase/diadenosine tetraphosphate (Ap4A) HIT family hydrolase/HKD family nuclease/SOS-response transcriptional repressor LexA
MPESCPFCNTERIEILAENRLAFAFYDRYPVSPGHVLIVTRRHTPDYFSCTADEKAAILDLMELLKARLDQSARPPEGYNMGFNAGQAAGQTVMHVHIHLIPRYVGDMEDPRGGVRHVIPEKGNYLLQQPEPLTDGYAGGNFYSALAPLLAKATQIDVLSAFIQDSGLDHIESLLKGALDRGARVRILTGDYLDITQAQALRRLLDWGVATEAEGAAENPEFSVSGKLHSRVVETQRINRAFHPKAWQLSSPDFGVAFVGSSNLSKSALVTGVEWNLRISRHRDRAAWVRIAASFQHLWNQGTPLQQGWIDAYERRVRQSPRSLPPGEIEAAPIQRLPDPNPIQVEALEALVESRKQQRQRALVVMATGLGKTVLAAHDIRTFTNQAAPSVLWLAHRKELLEQASNTLRKALPSARFAWMLAGERPPDSYDVLFASVQSIARPATLQRMAPDRFRYIVVDEVHHADAPSYRRILAHFSPEFLLGLTATPERADGGDIGGLFDDHLPFRADVGTGIQEDLLVPFRYFGLTDNTNYQHIPWRNGRFDTEALSEAIGTQARMEKLWSAWNETDKTASRTMVFCASVRHATFVRDWLARKGLRVRLCHGGGDSDDRTTSLDELSAGQIDAICSVDLFNEGVDCRPLDRVVMLRPTESPVLFLQQLGRGLRKSDSKKDLVVIDFVGNHKVFLDRVRTLLSLGGATPSLYDFVARREQSLPPGCSVELELEAIDLLKKLLPTERSAGISAVYRELKAARGERPRAGELVRMGFTLAPFLKNEGGWFGFVRSEGDLSESEVAVLTQAKDWLKEVQSTAMTKCFKMVVLEVLIEAEALGGKIGLPELARRSHAILARSPELFEDLEGVKELPDPRSPAPEVWEAYWRKNPVKAWCEGPWFRVEQGQFVSHIPTADRLTLEEMTRELVDARLAHYRRRREGSTDSIDVKVSWNQRDPILFLPSGSARRQLPEGEVDVRLPDDSTWRFRFAKIAVNVAHPIGSLQNKLPDLLRRWYGPLAGRPGTDRRVRFRKVDGVLRIEPLGELVSLQRNRFISYPSLKAAAGWAGEERLEPEAEEVLLPGPVGDHSFALRVSGDSMEGGPKAIHDGDWAIFEWARGLGPGALEGRVVLAAVGSEEEGVATHIKRVVKENGNYFLKSDNPAYPLRSAEGATIYARLVRTIRPAELAPEPGSTVDDVQATFGLSELPVGRISRVDGHLFLQVSPPTGAHDWRTQPVPGLCPGETAYILTKSEEGGTFTYLGVGRWRGEAWEIADAARP